MFDVQVHAEGAGGDGDAIRQAAAGPQAAPLLINRFWAYVRGYQSRDRIAVTLTGLQSRVYETATSHVTG